jgi:hypothetical protein
MEVNMKNRKKICIVFVLAAAVCIFASVTVIYAHCDTMSGPVIPDAKAALEKGDITAVLKWLKPEYEAEVKTAFSLAVKVRNDSPQAKELADRYFLETLIRVHRAGEGAPYTGLKDTPPEMIVTLADEALADGSADEVIKKIQEHLAEAIKEKFDKALKAAKNKDNSVEAGREFVESYVQYMHYVEGIHAAIVSKGGHRSEGAEAVIDRGEQAEHKH